LIIILVGIGGFIGATLRYLVGNWIQNLSGNPEFPYGTLLVNLIGCLIIGFVIAISETQDNISQEIQIFLTVGVLGGFTTFSAFGIDTVNFIRNGDLHLGAINIVLQLTLGILAAWLGLVTWKWIAAQIQSL
tara:strand:- start:904 stop:1299 length:396 start_codon:yes stop_codon:yes gene_type:complete